MKLFILIALMMIAFLLLPVPQEKEWIQFYRPAALAMLHGEDPYVGYGYYNPPWTLLPFIPIALLPDWIGRLTIFLMGLTAFITLLARLHAKPVAMVLFLTSMPALSCLQDGNLDWLPMLGVLLPAPIGLMLALTKPQIGLGVMLYWLVESWRAGGIRTTIRNFLPVTLLLLSWPLLYPISLVHFRALAGASWNMSIFPAGLLVGLYLLERALARRSMPVALASSPLLSPYFGRHSLVGLLLPLLDYPWLLAVASTILWIYVTILAKIL